MQVIKDKKEFKDICKDGSVVTAGNFDGVHIGHQAILKQTVDLAHANNMVSVVITFDTHPTKIVGQNTAPYLITSTPHKLKFLEKTEVDYCFLITFTKEFSQMSAEDFIDDILISTLNVKHMVIGYDFRFGKDAKGSYQMLESFGENNGFSMTEINQIDCDGLSLSSSSIRQAIKCADFDTASKLLGRQYSLFGRVVTGAKIGRTIGFPTANIDPLHELVPKTGVYAVKVKTKGGNNLYNGVLNIGYPPYFVHENLKNQIKIEVFILDFDADIYGEEIEVFFIDCIREEMMFNGKEALRKQIVVDLEVAKKMFDAQIGKKY